MWEEREAQALLAPFKLLLKLGHSARKHPETSILYIGWGLFIFLIVANP